MSARRKPRTGTEWKWASRRTYIAVRADEVEVGDLYANGATVTASRQATPDDCKYGAPKVNGRSVPHRQRWHIATSGGSFSVTCHASRPVVVGRLTPAEEPAQ